MPRQPVTGPGRVALRLSPRGTHRVSVAPCASPAPTGAHQWSVRQRMWAVLCCRARSRAHGPRDMCGPSGTYALPTAQVACAPAARPPTAAPKLARRIVTVYPLVIARVGYPLLRRSQSAARVAVRRQDCRLPRGTVTPRSRLPFRLSASSRSLLPRHWPCVVVTNHHLARGSGRCGAAVLIAWRGGLESCRGSRVPTQALTPETAASARRVCFFREVVSLDPDRQ